MEPGRIGTVLQWMLLAVKIKAVNYTNKPSSALRPVGWSCTWALACIWAQSKWYHSDMIWPRASAQIKESSHFSIVHLMTLDKTISHIY